MIEVKNLSKKYGKHIAVNNVSFTVKSGEILGFLGPNGAGKSTIMNILTGYLSPTQGRVSINGFDILKNPDKAKKEIGYLPETPPLYFDMTVKEYLYFVFELKKIKLPKDEHIAGICQVVKLSDVMNKVIKNLSKGYRQRVGFAGALIGNPSVLILDEPTVGLDPKQIIETRNLIKMLREKHTVIISSHILSEIQAVCDHVVILNKGEVAISDTLENLTMPGRLNTISARIEGDPKKVKNVLESLSNVDEVELKASLEENSTDYIIKSIENVDIRKDVFKAISDNDFILLSFGLNRPSLEQIFLEITEDSVVYDYEAQDILNDDEESENIIEEEEK